MAEDGKLELLRAHRTATDKYTYFLLAAAGACIAFAINQTNDAVISWSQLPLGAAVICWALSFFYGCRQVMGVLGLLQENYQLIRTMRGEHPDFPSAAEFTGWVSKRLEEKSKRAAQHAELQLGFLLAGAAFYIVWHGIEMYLRTPD
jgi:hypothetical protein